MVLHGSIKSERKVDIMLVDLKFNDVKLTEAIEKLDEIAEALRGVAYDLNSVVNMSADREEEEKESA